jgi:hypothetical protein
MDKVKNSVFRLSIYGRSNEQKYASLVSKLESWAVSIVSSQKYKYRYWLLILFILKFVTMILLTMGEHSDGNFMILLILLNILVIAALAFFQPQQSRVNAVIEELTFVGEGLQTFIVFLESMWKWRLPSTWLGGITIILAMLRVGALIVDLVL